MIYMDCHYYYWYYHDCHYQTDPIIAIFHYIIIRMIMICIWFTFLFLDAFTKISILASSATQELSYRNFPIRFLYIIYIARTSRTFWECGIIGDSIYEQVLDSHAHTNLDYAQQWEHKTNIFSLLMSSNRFRRSTFWNSIWSTTTTTHNSFPTTTTNTRRNSKNLLFVFCCCEF